MKWKTKIVRGEETREQVILIVKCKIMRNLGDGGRKGKMLERGFEALTIVFFA